MEPSKYLSITDDALFYEYECDEYSFCQTNEHDVVYTFMDKLYTASQEDMHLAVHYDDDFDTIIVGFIYDGDVTLDTSGISEIVDSLSRGMDCRNMIYQLSYKSKCDVIRELQKQRVLEPKGCRKIYKSQDANMLETINFLCSSSNLSTKVSSHEIAIYESVASDVYFNSFHIQKKREKYGFHVPSNMMVWRRNNHIYISGSSNGDF